MRNTKAGNRTKTTDETARVPLSRETGLSPDIGRYSRDNSHPTAAGLVCLRGVHCQPAGQPGRGRGGPGSASGNSSAITFPFSRICPPSSDSAAVRPQHVVYPFTSIPCHASPSYARPWALFTRVNVGSEIYHCQAADPGGSVPSSPSPSILYIHTCIYARLCI